jgi:hypothetical protein
MMRKLIDHEQYFDLHGRREAMAKLALGNDRLIAETDSHLMTWMGAVANRIIVEGVHTVRDELETAQPGAFDQLVVSLANFAAIRHDAVEIGQLTEAIDAELAEMGR